MKRYAFGISTLLLVSAILTGCNFNVQEATPTIDGVFEEPIDPLPEIEEVSPTPSPSPSMTPADAVVIVTSTPMPTDLVLPTETPTETPGPWEYEIQSGDVLGAIIQRPPFNYRSNAVIPLIVAMNDNIPNADSLPGEGSTILIPRPTATPIPEGMELTAVMDATRGVQTRGNLVLPENAQIGLHTVRENESVIGIVEQYGGMTLEILSQLNADINFLGCNFEEPAGGPNCNPLIRANQEINVLLPTPTPTLSPTPSGAETATPTPTYRPPMGNYPPDGGIAPAGIVTLHWVSVGILKPDQVYLIQVNDLTDDTSWTGVTRSTTMQLPSSLIPTDGEDHTIEWTIAVATSDNQGQYQIVSGVAEPRRFIWRSR